MRGNARQCEAFRGERPSLSGQSNYKPSQKTPGFPGASEPRKCLVKPSFNHFAGTWGVLFDGACAALWSAPCEGSWVGFWVALFEGAWEGL
jgi:hypothetical protein